MTDQLKTWAKTELRKLVSYLEEDDISQIVYHNHNTHSYHV